MLSQNIVELNDFNVSRSKDRNISNLVEHYIVKQEQFVSHDNFNREILVPRLNL